jgi:2-polyprenyl-6-methoxyphenol hydroxylase-like FAD-dependent oxidoreductase
LAKIDPKQKGGIKKAFVLKAAGAQQFKDVPESHWTYDAVQALSLHGITTGVGNDLYAPDNSITRAQYAVFDSDYAFTLFIPQSQTEELLEKWALELGVALKRGHEVTGFIQDKHGVEVRVRRPEGNYMLNAGFMIGTDGAGSLVRKEAGIGFNGSDMTLTAILGDVGTLMTAPLESGIYRFALIDAESRNVDLKPL